MFAGTHLYTWLEKGTVRIKCLSQEHDPMSLAKGLQLRLLDLESSTLNMRALCVNSSGMLQARSQDFLRVGAIS